MKNKKLKNVLLGIGLILLFILLFYLIFRDNAQEIVEQLTAIPLWWIVVILGAGVLYEVGEAFCCRMLVRRYLPEFSLRNALATVYLGFFVNTATFGTGLVVAQSYYLYKRGLSVGKGVSMMGFEYIFHKSTIVLYATVILLLQGGTLLGKTGASFQYLLMAYGVCAVIILAYVLVCTNTLVHKIILFLLDWVPLPGKLGQRKAGWREQLVSLYEESRLLLKDRVFCLKLIVMHAIKLTVFYALPYVCFCAAGQAEAMTPGISLCLSALMMLLTSAIPNLAGMGPAEVSFLWLFTPFVGDVATRTALILFRLATYYAPFVIGMVVSLVLRRRGGKLEEMEYLEKLQAEEVAETGSQQ